MFIIDLGGHSFNLHNERLFEDVCDKGIAVTLITDFYTL